MRDFIVAQVIPERFCGENCVVEERAGVRRESAGTTGFCSTGIAGEALAKDVLHWTAEVGNVEPR